jgi:tetratricopeptide (TPR) repeat protein
MKFGRKTIVGILVLVLLLACAGVGGKYFLNRRTLSWRQQGIAASIAGDNVKAVNLLTRYLNRRPGDILALSYYVKSRELVPLPNGQHLAQTIAGLRMLLSLDPSRVADRRHLMELYDRLDRFPEALDTANEILTKNPKDVQTLEIKTRVLMQLRENHDAMDAVQGWAAADPDAIQPQMVRMTLELRLGRSSDVIISDAQRLREAHPGDPRFEFLQGYAYSQAGDDTQATQWLKSAAAHPKLTEDLAKLMIRELDNLGLGNDSLALLQRMVKQGAGPDLRHQLADRYWELRKWDDLAPCLADLKVSDPSADPTLLAMKAFALLNLGRASDAQACADTLSRRVDPVARAWALVLGDAQRPASVNDKDLARECRSAVSVDPANPYLLYYLGDCEARLGELDLAGGAFQRAMDLDPAWNAPAVRLVEALLQNGRPDQAFEVASVAIHHNPTSAAAVIALARAWSAGIADGSIGKADELLSLLGQIQRQLPEENRVSLIAVQLLAEQGKLAEAKERARTELERNPAPGEPFFLTLAALSRKFGLGVEAECFERCQKAHGITANFAYAKALDQSLADPHSDAVAVFDDLAKQAGAAADLSWKLARARCMDITASPRARSAWIALRDAYPTDLAVQQAVVSAQTVRGDWQVLQPAIDHLHALTGDGGLAWRLALDRLMVQSPRSEDDVEKAAVQLTDLIQQYPGLPEPHVLLGRALVHMKRIDGAIQQFSTAARLDPTNVPIAIQLAALLQSQGDFQRVQQELDRVSPQLRSNLQRTQAAVLLDKQGNTADAAKLLEQSVAPSGLRTGDQRASDLFLAFLYRQQHQYDRADALVTKLMEHPDVPTVQFAASLYTDEGKLDQANQVLRTLDAMKLAPGDKELVLASHSAETGDLRQAAQYYHAAASKNPANALAWRMAAACEVGLDQRDQAMATLAEAAHALPNDNGLQLLQLQSSLLRAACANEQLRPVVLSVIRDPANSDTDLEILRTVEASWKSNESEQLVSRLQDIINRHPDSIDASMQLLYAYQSMDRPGDALTVAQHVIDTFPNDVRAARAAVNICELSRRWKDLQPMAEVLKRRSPDDAVAADIAIAMSQVGRGQAGEAIEQLSPYIPAAKANPEKYADLLSLYACALGSDGRGADAIDLIWPQVESSSQWRLRWISIARDLPDAQESARWLDRLAGILAPTDITGRAALAEAYNFVGRRVGDQSLIRKSTDLFASVSQSPAADALSLLAAAVQAEGRGDWEQAQTEYRQALSKNPTLYVAANNLAMLIVTHGGDAREAITLAQQAVDLQPRVATFYDSLAAAHHAAGDAQAAVQDESIAIRLDPDAPEWKVRSAQYQLDAGNPTAASRIIQDMDLKGNDAQTLTPALQQQLDLIRNRLKKLG